MTGPDAGSGAGPGAGRRPEPRWPPALAVVALVTLPLVLPDHLRLGPGWLVAVLGALYLGSIAAAGGGPGARRPLVRRLAIALTAMFIVTTGWSTARLIDDLVTGGASVASAGVLLSSGAVVWSTNAFLFGVLFWELDGGGPERRLGRSTAGRDFAFPQEMSPAINPPGWRPFFLDYVYIGLTNGLAFSPTDAMPLTARGKLLMALQAVVSFLVLGLVVARAVNVLT